jgi:crotonobetainyl-CoA:carnitine CoA-transferase CaiB-like acyl-CoA transferase
MVRMIAGTPLVGSPVRMDGARADSGLAPPALGEHTNEILAALGLASEEVERLRAASAIG